MKGGAMWTMAFFIGAFVALVAACFLFANRENSKASDAQKSADMALKHIEAFDGSVKDIEEKIKRLADSVDRIVPAVAARDEDFNNRLQKAKEKIEWIEMKLNAAHESTQRQRLMLTQEKPLEIKVLYKRAAEPAAAPSKDLDPKARAELLKKVKKQVKELSQ